ncbi:MAG TPA: hypothetical protein VKT25_15455, partial [Ktedonobacteraceae bacterium]|nr:hypothetical protein [Ktedonobacteraceae bacterium]
DRYVPEIHLSALTLKSRICSDEELRAADCVVILTNHSYIDYEQVIEKASLVIDTRNATGHLPPAAHIWRFRRPTGSEEPDSQQKREGAA